jgi:sporulation protein YlmC with PRC-barrel domain
VKEEVKKMNKGLAIFAVVSIFTLGFAADSHAGSSMVQIGFRDYDAANLLGSMVTTLDGEELGRILELEIDSLGHVVFALIVQNGLDEFPGRLVAVPFSALMISEAKSQPIRVVLDVDKEKFYTAPSFDTKYLDNPQWAIGLYRFFGQQPYWTEEEAGKAASSPRKGNYFFVYP